MSDLGEPLRRHPLPHGCMIVDRDGEPAKLDIVGGPERIAMIDDILARINATKDLDPAAIGPALATMGNAIRYLREMRHTRKLANVAHSMQTALDAVRSPNVPGGMEEPSPAPEADGAGEARTHCGVDPYAEDRATVTRIVDLVTKKAAAMREAKPLPPIEVDWGGTWVRIEKYAIVPNTRPQRVLCKIGETELFTPCYRPAEEES